MTLSIDNKIDPIAVIGEGRQLSTCPFHFVQIKFIGEHKNVKSWIWENLTERFYINYDLAAFENPAEASMFAMVKDQFNNQQKSQ